MKYPASQDPKPSPLEIIREVVKGTEIFTIRSDPHNPPDVFFDTNVWRSMNQTDIEHLQNLKKQRGFRYRYSITNYVELVSHLEDAPSKQWPDPFGIVRASFRRMNQLCEEAILPSPEMQFLHTAKLAHYLDPVWIPNAEQTAAIVKLIANANTIIEVTGKGIEQLAFNHVPR